jgi:hypothetical protein
MFDNDVRHYAPTPRTLQSSKFGAYATLSTTASGRRVSALIWALVAVGVACAVVVVGVSTNGRLL